MIPEFHKTKEYLVCVDSDGCVMDTMDIKHKKCFGPCFVTEWGLEAHKEELLRRWDDINLYTQTRGINRFKGLCKILKEVDATIQPIEGLADFENWVETTKELSNGSLQKEIEKVGTICLKKALNWSIVLNQGINALSDEEKMPYAEAPNALDRLHEYADIAVVSSANRGAVIEEWTRCDVARRVDVILTQEQGSKAHCISMMKEYGYAPDKVLMVGDAVGDLRAAEENGVYYYPILVKRENESWIRLASESVKKFIDGTYGGEYQEAIVKEFFDNLR